MTISDFEPSTSPPSNRRWYLPGRGALLALAMLISAGIALHRLTTTNRTSSQCDADKRALIHGGDAHDHDFRPQATRDRRPVLFVYEFDPWWGGIGPLSPWCAIYSDGLVIIGGHHLPALDRGEYNGGSTNEYEYKAVVLGSGELGELLDLLQLEALRTLKDHYPANVDDAACTVLFLPDGNRREVAVEDFSIDDLLAQAGLPTDPFDDPASLDEEWLNESRKKVPRPFLNVIDRLVSFRLKHEHAKAWKPEKVEVMIWPERITWPGPDDARAIPWPKDWSGFNHPSAHRPNSMYFPAPHDEPIAHCVVLGAEHLGRIRMMAANRMVNIDGTTRRIAYRYVIPFEELRWNEQGPLPPSL